MARLANLFVVAMVSVLLVPAIARAAEEDVKLDKVPQAILDTVKARFPDAKLRGASKETEEGQLVYEITIKHEGHNIDVTLTPEGKLLLIERQIERKALPDAAAKKLEDEYPKAEYRIVEEIIKVDGKEEKLDFYEVLLVTADKKAVEVQVTAEGKIINVEKKNSADAD